MVKDGWEVPEVLNVPLFLQTDPNWATSIYDFTTSSIRTLGCALSSAAMVLQFHGVTTTPDGLVPTNPKTLNEWLISQRVPGYGLSGDLRWWRLSGYSNNQIKIPPNGGIDVTKGYTEEQVRQFIDTDLANENPVIIKTQYFNQFLATTVSHFVVTKGKTNNTYAINDPRSADITTLEEGDYPILGIRRIEKSNGMPISRLTITGASPIQILVIDSLSKKTGFDYTDNQFLFDIPGSSYYEDSIGSDSDVPAQAGPVKVVDIIQPEGIYKVEVIGEALGVYTLTINAADIEGEFTEINTSGATDSGNISSFEVNFSVAPGQAPVVERKATIATMKEDIFAALNLGLINNQGVANSLLQKLDAAEVKLNQDLSKTAKNILNALRNEINVQKGKHLTGDIANILLEDLENITQSISLAISNSLSFLLADIHVVITRLFNFISQLITLFR